MCGGGSVEETATEAGFGVPGAGDASASQSHDGIVYRLIDFEARLGFRSAAGTHAGLLLTLLLAVLATTGIYLLLLWLPHGRLTALLRERGVIPYPTVFLGWWGASILFVKWRKLAGQRRAFSVEALPFDPLLTIQQGQAAQWLQRLRTSVIHPTDFWLFRRLESGLLLLRNGASFAEVELALRGQAEADYNEVVSSYTVLHGLLWAVPVLGFIGTVQGLAVAVGGFGSVIATAKDISVIKSALRGVTGGLAVAFDTTLLALVITVVLHLLMTFLKRAEERCLARCDQSGDRLLLRRLRKRSVQEDAAPAEASW